MTKPWDRFKIRLLAGLAVGSITICILSVILWPLSYATGVQLSIRNGAGTRYALVTVPGQVGLAVVRGEPRAWVSLDGCAKSFGSDASPLSNTRDKLRWFWQKPQANKAGFGANQGNDLIYFGEVNDSFTCEYSSHFAPIWVVTILSFAIPVAWYRARQRRQYRFENDLCMSCGSDMTASPYRCPKCGKERQW